MKLSEQVTFEINAYSLALNSLDTSLRNKKLIGRPNYEKLRDFVIKELQKRGCMVSDAKEQTDPQD